MRVRVSAKARGRGSPLVRLEGVGGLLVDLVLLARTARATLEDLDVAPRFGFGFGFGFGLGLGFDFGLGLPAGLAALARPRVLLLVVVLEVVGDVAPLLGCALGEHLVGALLLVRVRARVSGGGGGGGGGGGSGWGEVEERLGRGWGEVGERLGRGVRARVR